MKKKMLEAIPWRVKKAEGINAAARIVNDYLVVDFTKEARAWFRLCVAPGDMEAGYFTPQQEKFSNYGGEVTIAPFYWSSDLCLPLRKIEEGNVSISASSIKAIKSFTGKDKWLNALRNAGEGKKKAEREKRNKKKLDYIESWTLGMTPVSKKSLAYVNYPLPLGGG